MCRMPILLLNQQITYAKFSVKKSTLNICLILMVMRIRHRRYPGISWPEFKAKAMTSNNYSVVNPLRDTLCQISESSRNIESSEFLLVEKIRGRSDSWRNISRVVTLWRESSWIEGQSSAEFSWAGTSTAETQNGPLGQTVTEQNSLAREHWSQSFLAFWVHSFCSMCSE